MAITQKQVYETVSEGLAHREGWYAQGKIQSVARRMNNPGCLRHWKDRRGDPYPVTNGYVEFPTPEIGWSALRAQCKINIMKRQLSLKQFILGKGGIYEGFVGHSVKNDARGYIAEVLAFINRRLGLQIDENTPLYLIAPQSQGVR